MFCINTQTRRICDSNMVFSYNYGKRKKGKQNTNAPPLLAILMATAVHQSNTDGIA